MATTMPSSTSSTSTPAVVARARTSSLRRNLANRTNSGTSTSRMAAYTTTAARAASGNAARRGRRVSRASRVQATVASPASWVRLPTASPMAVRLPLLLTGNPCSRPAPRLAAPRARSSRWGVDGLVVPAGERAAGEDVVGVADEGDPERRGQHGGQLGRADVGYAGHRDAAGDLADEPHSAVGQVEQRGGRGGAEHPEQRHRRAGGEGSAHQHRGQRDQAEHGRRPVHLVEPAEHLAELGHEAVGVLRHAEQLAELRGDHDRGDAGEVADQDRAGQQVGQRAQPEQPAQHAEAGHEQGERGGEGGDVVSRRRRPWPGRRPSSVRWSTRDRPTAGARSRGRRRGSAPRPRPTGRSRAGTPASSAYAITWGTRYAVTVTPASTSPRSQVRS